MRDFFVLTQLVMLGYDLIILWECEIKKNSKTYLSDLLTNFINSLPEKFDTNVGHDGSIVSGGQLQRIGIARALYLKPDILILDEPTSNLDSEIEMAIINSLFKLKDLTIILISHNKAILEKCDRLVKLN